ncbi:transcriptional regulator with GAF, ATPase, and Fis domain [Variovorax boronicumulans]|uniref:Transcriptional regulator with GAF, ATPase, and Fis domain n=1 Tax=Variovorax boronicumulans TaxID=436515 RepID=A0AAW8D434_9BURK|nr:MULTISPECIES: GAF domain-containing protein [Variovorax]MDP9897325.1 transcriptional regulator with GAF, ATPase, and Fis domain [Variovorax boronicumulans]MDQ0057365.1 transcriptional regulator with GAF, ATPase, and Fis domain [Variovorax boronicumulans]MDQ0611649.1 transcriptional regulator with GAF, ATPase, and Fis domain [Variovorax sp. W1I1]
MQSTSLEDSLSAVALAHADIAQPHATFDAIDKAVAATIGHRLFTILVHHRQARESERVYTNMREAYPVGGRKPITDSPWMQQVMQQGLPYIGRNAEDLRDVFYDHELIVSLGCRSVLNIPLRWQGETLGTLNMLHEENWYGDGHVELARVFAQLAVPAVMAQQQTKESIA